MNINTSLSTALIALSAFAGEALADGITSQSSIPGNPSFDIQSASVVRDAQHLIFRMDIADDAGKKLPSAIGMLKGSTVYSYVWPTGFDPSIVGFSPNSGLLSFAITAHPDFDDTPLFDEDGDGDPKNDGRKWHSHWVVLTKTDQCGSSGLKVRDIKEGEAHDLPKTWPNLPILIDSPGWHPVFTPTSVEARVPFDRSTVLSGISFDGVTSALRVNANAHAPLLCVNAVYDVASGDLSLPGRTR